MDDYKEKYKQAVKKIKDLFDEGEQKGFTIITYRKDFEKIFPELKEEPEDERIRKELIRVFSNREKYRIAQSFGDITVSEALTWLKKQGKKEPKETFIWKHWKDGIAGNADGEPIYLIKNGYTYSLSSCLGCECDYILLSDLDKLRQGELKPISFDDSAMIDSYLNDYCCKIYNALHKENGGILSYARLQHLAKDIFKWCKENQDEQKSTDKPKFHEGDWIVQGNIGVYKVIEICESWYEVIDFEDNHYSISFDKEYMCHLWTIQDAKDGDVLYFNNDISGFHSIGLFKRLASKNEINGGTYRCYARYGGFNEESKLEIAQNNNELHHCGTKVYPATKEQRDLLFSKMGEAGYEWDAEKKELKTVDKKSQRVVSAEAKEALYNKPAWSVEDMSKVQRICMYLDEAKKYYADITEVRECMDWLKSIEDRVLPQPKQKWSEEDERNLQGIIDEIEANKNLAPDYDLATYDRFLSWLKSLRHQNHWKPSKEQMQALLSEVEGWEKGCPKQKVLESLYNDLKKLRGGGIMKQPLMLQSDCVDCPFYDGFGQCTQYGNITEEIISKCEFNKQ